jgi:hypothetical protein
VGETDALILTLPDETVTQLENLHSNEGLVSAVAAHFRLAYADVVFAVVPLPHPQRSDDDPPH